MKSSALLKVVGIENLLVYSSLTISIGFCNETELFEMQFLVAAEHFKKKKYSKRSTKSHMTKNIKITGGRCPNVTDGF